MIVLVAPITNRSQKWWEKLIKIIKLKTKIKVKIKPRRTRNWTERFS